MDSSALLKIYLREPEIEQCKKLLDSATNLMSARHTAIEVRRNLSLALKGHALSEARTQFERDWQNLAKVELNQAACETAATVAEEHGFRTLDALHLGAAELLRTPELEFLTYDVRQGRAARQLGWTVRGTQVTL